MHLTVRRNTQNPLKEALELVFSLGPEEEKKELKNIAYRDLIDFHLKRCALERHIG